MDRNKEEIKAQRKKAKSLDTTPEELHELARSADMGTLWLIWRNPNTEYRTIKKLEKHPNHSRFYSTIAPTRDECLGVYFDE